MTNCFSLGISQKELLARLEANRAKRPSLIRAKVRFK